MTEDVKKSVKDRPVWFKSAVVTGIYGVLWVFAYLDWVAWKTLPEVVLLVVFAKSVALLVYWHRFLKPMSRLQQRGYWSIAVLPIWQLSVFVSYYLMLPSVSLLLTRIGLAVVFVLGLGWMIWYVEQVSARLLAGRKKVAFGVTEFGRTGTAITATTATPLGRAPGGEREWNPLNLDAWYYGKRKKKLHQTILTVFAYTLTFILLAILLMQLRACNEIYELPAGGGENKPLVEKVQIKKIRRIRFVVNPLAATLFGTPDIDKEYKEILKKATEHTYKRGHGKGKGAGYSGGTKRGKVRFIRLKYNGRDWDRGMDLNSGKNLLSKYRRITNQVTAVDPEFKTIEQLGSFPVGKSPPVVYMVGDRSFTVSPKQIKILREYLTTKRGMIFADCAGPGGFDSSFRAMMNRVLPKTQPTPIQLDDEIHQNAPRGSLPTVPIVAPHAGRTSFNWKIGSRVAVYYHPGDIGDAWGDGHAGIRASIYEQCYDLGISIISYAHTQYDIWLNQRKAYMKR